MRAGAGIRRISESAVMLLPQPDSPTSATTSPGAMRRFTPSTARTVPASVKMCVVRFSTDSKSAIALNAPGSAG